MARLFVYSGAGLSAASGVPTFRGTGGLWNGASIDDVCNIATWKDNFDRVHDFYNQRRVELGTVHPNTAHLQIAEWSRRYETVVVTTNVDDLLERGGCRDVEHLHGRLCGMRCTACGAEWDIGYEVWDQTARCPGRDGRCLSKRGVKPAVVFFGEDASVPYRRLVRHIDGLKSDDVVLVVGSSCLVVPFQGMLHNRPGYKIIVNLQPVEGGSQTFDHAFYRPVEESLDEIDRLIRSKMA